MRLLRSLFLRMIEVGTGTGGDNIFFGIFPKGRYLPTVLPNSSFIYGGVEVVGR